MRTWTALNIVPAPSRQQVDGNTFPQSSEKILFGLAKKRNTGMEPPKGGGGGHNPFSTKGLRLHVAKVSPAQEFFETYAISQPHQKVNMRKYIKRGEPTC